jgi:hypothetical protein
MNNTSTWIWFILYAHHRSKRDGDLTKPTFHAWYNVLRKPVLELLEIKEFGKRNGGVWFVQRFWCFVSEQPVLNRWFDSSLTHGRHRIWLWSDPSKFDSPITSQCDPTLRVQLLIGTHPRFSSQPLRILSLMMYSLVPVPGLNLIPPFAFFLALHILYNKSRKRHSKFWVQFYNVFTPPVKLR